MVNVACSPWFCELAFSFIDALSDHDMYTAMGEPHERLHLHLSSNRIYIVLSAGCYLMITRIKIRGINQ